MPGTELRQRLIAAVPDPILRRAIHRFWPYQEPELRRIGNYVDPAKGAVDIGTWWGPWTAAMAKRCPAVHSIEPQPQLAARLRAWVPNNVTVHETAIGDSIGQAVLGRPDSRPGTDGLASLRDAERAADQIPVAVTTIDALNLTGIGLIKIDVEGLELAALRGGEETLKRERPRLMIEIEQRHLDSPIDTVFSWLTDRGYEGHYLRGPRSPWEPLSGFDVERDQLTNLHRPKHALYINAFLFTPDEQRWRPA